MYDSSWQKASRSSHPNLWNPPIVAPMIRSVIPENETNLSREYPAPTEGIDNQQPRLPSVDEILFKIQHQEAYRQPHQLHPQTDEVRLLPTPYPPSFANQEQLGVVYWQQASLQTNQPQFDQRLAPQMVQPLAPAGPHLDPRTVIYQPPGEQVRIETLVPQFPASTQTLASDSTLDEEQHKKDTQGTPAKKRGRKKKSDTICSHCQSTQTPEWRRGPDGSRTLCNACGLFYSKLTKKFGFDDANMIFAYKKRHNEVQDRIVPTIQQKNRYMSESMTE